MPACLPACHVRMVGGDWALQRSGAILLEGTERVHIVGNHITRVDGNGIILSNYNRNATIASNEMSWIGDGAIAAWGSTGNCLDAKCSRKLAWGVGPDARGGNQPREYTAYYSNHQTMFSLLVTA